MLIELVKGKPELYDLTSLQYSDNVAKRGWVEISRQMGCEGSKCKERWESLRAQYRKHKNKKTKSGQAADGFQKWKFEDQMSFLLAFTKDRTRVTSLEKAENEAEYSDNSEHDDTQERALGDEASGVAPDRPTLPQQERLTRKRKTQENNTDKSPQPQRSFRPPYPRRPYHPQLQPRSQTGSSTRFHNPTRQWQGFRGTGTRGSRGFQQHTSREASKQHSAGTVRISPNRTPAELMRTAEPRPTPSFRITTEPVSDSSGGRLTIFVDQWWSAPRSIFNIIKKGFHWTWQSQAPQLCTPIHLDSTPNPDLSLAVTDLLSKQAIYQVSPQPCFLSRVFLVLKQTGGLRFIINLTQLNKHIHCPRFHMLNHSVLADMLSPPA
ncbi:hypothetical protein O3P69_009016 [Scylla paramamosain]|uniref:MADF domain-containing protein n=1 Tax=Scylla paramamosain TaxID=85552 RepID=A0AAW0TQZ2_SCYPA